MQMPCQHRQGSMAGGPEARSLPAGRIFPDPPERLRLATRRPHMLACRSVAGRHAVARFRRRPRYARIRESAPTLHKWSDARASDGRDRSEEDTSELQSLKSITYAVFCLKKTMINIVCD